MSQSAILSRLEWGDWTIPELVEECEVSESTIRVAILKLHHRCLIHITAWQPPTGAGGGRHAMIWALGAGEDAPPPPRIVKHKHGRAIGSTKREDALIASLRRAKKLP